jgi:hypothetical protein
MSTRRIDKIQNMSGRYFTLAEAEALIPVVRRLMGDAQDLKARIDAKGALLRKAPPAGAAALALAQGQVDFLVSQINARLEELVALGCRPTGLEPGLVDFPSRLDGREVNLCWKMGETRIDFWHGLEEGFQGRKPLPASSRASH